MRREIREVSPEKGIIQITTPDERFYARRILENTAWDFVPSVTWICDAGLPKGIGFYKWLATKGWSEAEAIKEAAGDKGSKVHQAISVLLAGGTVGMEDAFATSDGEPEELTPDEYECLMSFVEWFQEFKPEVIAQDYTVWNERYRYSGTVDVKCRLNYKEYRGVYIVDFKTSLDIWPSHKLQVSAYKHADMDRPKATKLAILQVGYRRNKTKKWKFTEVADQFPLFLAARKIWANECEGITPQQKDYPMSLSLGAPVINDCAYEAEKTLEIVTE